MKDQSKVYYFLKNASKEDIRDVSIRINLRNKVQHISYIYTRKDFMSTFHVTEESLEDFLSGAYDYRVSDIVKIDQIYKEVTENDK